MQSFVDMPLSVTTLADTATTSISTSLISLFICVFLAPLAKPNLAAVDDMQLLEQRAQALAAEAEADKPRLKKDILFVRWALTPFVFSIYCPFLDMIFHWCNIYRLTFTNELTKILDINSQ